MAIVVARLLLRSPGGDYKVKARFQNAAQLVKGNLVQTGGAPIGTVETIDLTPDGQAEVTMKLKDDYVPLRRGTLATIRQASLSGVANRYIDLRSDCKPSGGEVSPTEGNPGCRIADPQVVGGRTQGTFPHIDESSYAGR